MVKQAGQPCLPAKNGKPSAKVLVNRVSIPLAFVKMLQKALSTTPERRIATISKAGY
jgi:hypothetical protein